MKDTLIFILLLSIHVNLMFFPYEMRKEISTIQATLTEQQNVTIKREIHNSIKEVFAKPWP